MSSTTVLTAAAAAAASTRRDYRLHLRRRRLQLSLSFALTRTSAPPFRKSPSRTSFGVVFRAMAGAFRIRVKGYGLGLVFGVRVKDK